ncbi:MAG: aldo/keto reductase [Flammeovirgaceae bacterium]
MNYKLFGNSGLRVSELCLGAMTFGTEWGTGADKATSKAVFDAFVAAGGNFIDTANRYTEGTSETYLGEFVAPDRDRFVIATKYSLYDHIDDVNATGNHRKNMMRSVEGSLKRLNTDYIDVLWVHMWDFTTPIEEMMRGLDDLVRSGKVHYIGISDTPAWVVSQANTLAKYTNQIPFVGLQIEYSLIQRTPEADLLPMAKHFGMAVTPWSPLGAGMLTGKYNDQIDEEGRLSEKSVKVNDRNRAIARKVVEVATQLDASPAQVALNWLRQQHSSIIPIVGARKESQIKDSLGCLNFQIPGKLMDELNALSAVPLGFPHEFFENPNVKKVLYGNNFDKLEGLRK